jgi:amidase
MASVTDGEVAAGQLWRLGAGELAGMIRSGMVSASEVVAAHLDRIEQVDAEVNAVRVTLAETAMAAAEEADRLLAAGGPVGPLHGVPFTVKECIDVAGTATTNGVVALAEAVAPADAPAVAHLREAGAIPIGRTNLPDFQLRWHTDNDLAGATRNPWDQALTPGGSSGGEAAALATGMTPLGLGTDLGGSLRFPSQCCGTAALRPTLGRVAQAASIEPADPPFGMQLMSVVGPMARRVDDLRAAFEVLRRPSDRDPWYAPVEAGRPGGPARVAVVTGQDTHPDVAAGVRRAADALAGAGYQVEELDPPALQDATTVWLTVVGHDLGLIWPVLEAVASKDAIGFLTAALAAGPPTDPAAATHALVARHGLARAWAAFQRSHPLILGPVSTRPPSAVPRPPAASWAACR